ncbi:MAG TPA: hypothetical protein VGG72_05215 [Bryobacteraceae bacterium]|jgi:hypothetical protein
MFSWRVRGGCALSAVIIFVGLCESSSAQQALPRTPDGKPNFQGIWQARSGAANDLAGKGIVEGGAIPYQPAAAAAKLKNFTNRKTADPLSKCYMPGVPRIMYMDYPFQIFQTPEHVAITFQWSQVYRLIYLNGKPALHDVVDSWMGDSRAHWEGDTLVVEVTGQNDKTWFDMAGDFHSDALSLTERYRMLDADTIQYEATITDPKTFTKAWKISVPLVRQKNMARLMEYQCQAEAEEASGDFERDPRTWYPKPGSPPSPLGPPAAMPPPGNLPAVKTGTNLRRAADGKPELTGYYESNAGGANYGLEKHGRDAFTPATRGVVIDPADGSLPYQTWSRAERINREEPYRGYDDPTAHCFVAGVPRSMYVPSPMQILQPPGYIVMLFERMSWRIVPLDGRAHIADNIRLWQGDSVGHWEGDVLVIDTTNMNGKTWLNEVGDVVSHAEHVVERFIPTDTGKITYRATVTDPIVYSRPWTIEIPLSQKPEELLEVACHEDNGDLQNLKNVRDEYRAQQKKGK